MTNEAIEQLIKDMLGVLRRRDPKVTYDWDTNILTFKGEKVDVGAKSGYKVLEHYINYIFDGEFENGEMKYGTFTFLNDDRYEGQFINGKFGGKGKYFYSNGDMYDGEWSNDKKNGIGKYVLNDGSEIEGEWKDDFPVKKEN